MVERAAHVGRRPFARESRAGRLQGAFGGPPAIGNDRNPLIVGCQVPHAGGSRNCLAGKLSQPASRRCQPSGGVKHAGQANVGGKPPAAFAFGRRIEPRQRLADQPRLGSAACRWIGWCAATGRFLGQFTEGCPPGAADDETIRRVAVGFIDVPAIGGGADQHCARRCRSLAHGLGERADRGRAGGDPDAVGPAFRPGQRVCISLRQRRRLDGNGFPCRSQFVGDDLGQRGPDSLAGLDLRHGDGDPAVSGDLDEGAERLLATCNHEIAGEATRPKRVADNQPDARAAADQQGAAVKLQWAYWALSARRSILPVPRRGRGSAETMIRAGILNLASLPSRCASRLASSSCSPSFT